MDQTLYYLEEVGLQSETLTHHHASASPRNLLGLSAALRRRCFEMFLNVGLENCSISLSTKWPYKNGRLGLRGSYGGGEGLFTSKNVVSLSLTSLFGLDYLSRAGSLPADVTSSKPPEIEIPARVQSVVASRRGSSPTRMTGAHVVFSLGLGYRAVGGKC